MTKFTSPLTRMAATCLLALGLLGLTIGIALQTNGSNLAGSAPVRVNSPAQLSLYSFENGTEGWSGTLVPNDPGGTVTITTTHVTDGLQALQLDSVGGYFSVRPNPALDLSGWQSLKFDVYSPYTQTVYVALQTGSGLAWQQSPDYTVGPYTTTVTVDLLNDFGGPLPDADNVRQVNVYYPAGTFVQDYFRLEGQLPTATPTNTPTPILATPTPPAELPGFRVIGRFLYDYCGEQVVLRGVNKMIYYTDIDGIPAYSEIAKTGANVVRIVWLTDGSASDLDTAISNALANQLIPLVELHDATGDWSLLGSLVDYWTRPDIVDVLNKYDRYLLINIGNEVGDATVSEEDFKAGYKLAVLRMRLAGIHVPLIIDGTNYGKNFDILQSSGPYLLSMDPDHNLMFSVHMWWPLKLGYTDQSVIDALSQSVQTSLPLIVGEFASQWDNTPDGVIPYRTILEQTYLNEVGMLPWEWGPGNDPQTWWNMTDDGTYDTLHGWGLETAITSTYSILNTAFRPYSLVNGACSGPTPTPPPSPTPYAIPPVVTIISPTVDTLYPAGATVTIQSTASDEDGSVSSVAFLANGLSLVELTSPPYTYDWVDAPTGDYLLIAQATDNAGNVTNSTSVHVVVGTPRVFSINDSTIGSGMNQFDFSGIWNVSYGTHKYQQDDHLSSTVDSYFQFQFQGTGIDLYGLMAPYNGIAAVSIDDGTEVLVDYYGPDKIEDTLIWSSPDLVYGDHTLKVRVTGTKNPASTDAIITVDRVAILTTHAAFMPIIGDQSEFQIVPRNTPTPTVPAPTLPSPPTLPPPRTPWPTNTPTNTPTPTQTTAAGIKGP
jgi:hypothetical protein